MEFVAIDTPVQLLKTPRGNTFLLVIIHQYSKLILTALLKNITAATVAMAFVTHWVPFYGPSICLLSENGRQFTVRFFRHVCRIFGVEKWFAISCSPQYNIIMVILNRLAVPFCKRYAITWLTIREARTCILTSYIMQITLKCTARLTVHPSSWYYYGHQSCCCGIQAYGETFLECDALSTPVETVAARFASSDWSSVAECAI